MPFSYDVNFDDDEWKDIEAMGAAMERADRIIRIVARSIDRVFLSGLLVTMVALLWFAHQATEGSVLQMLAVSFAAGIGLYFAMLGILAVPRYWMWELRAVLLLSTVGLGYLASLTHGLSRDLLVEACSGLSLAVILELTLNRVRSVIAAVLGERQREASNL